MNKTPGLSRRRFFGASAATVAAGTLGLDLLNSHRSNAMNAVVQSGGDAAIRPFRVNIPEADLAELRRRILAARLPEKETVADFSQGVPLATVQKLAKYWGTEYDWRKVESRINSVPNFITEIDGL